MFKGLLLLISLTLTILAAETKTDSTTGLIIDEGMSDIKENCTVCHTGRFVVVNGGNRNFWKKKIYIMQNAYGLWEINRQQKERMIKYLSKNYSKKVNVSIDR